MRNRLPILTNVAAFVVLVATPAFAQSSKAAWRFAEVIALSQSADTDPNTTPDAGPNTTGWVNILRTYIKTPNDKELALGVSLQCGIVTDTTVRSKGGELDSSAAQARIRVRVKITPPGGADPIYAEPNNGAYLTDILPVPAEDARGITYCDRYQKLEAKFAGLNCTADDAGVVTCTDPEELRLILKTLNAHHFNFLYANANPGVQKIEVQAQAEAGVVLGGTMLGAAGAEAFAGAGALSVETIRLVKDADGTTDLENLH